MPSAEVTSTGTGFHLSSVSGAIASTASTAPVSSRRSPIRVAIPVHCAPSRGLQQRRANMRRKWTEEDFIGAFWVAGAAMHARFERGIIRLDELAGVAALLGIARPRNAAIGTEIAGCGAADRRRPYRRRGIATVYHPRVPAPTLERPDNPRGDPAAIEIALLGLDAFVIDPAFIDA